MGFIGGDLRADFIGRIRGADPGQLLGVGGPQPCRQEFAKRRHGWIRFARGEKAPQGMAASAVMIHYLSSLSSDTSHSIHTRPPSRSLTMKIPCPMSL